MWPARVVTKHRARAVTKQKMCHARANTENTVSCAHAHRSQSVCSPSFKPHPQSVFFVIIIVKCTTYIHTDNIRYCIMLQYIYKYISLNLKLCCSCVTIYLSSPRAKNATFATSTFATSTMPPSSTVWSWQFHLFFSKKFRIFFVFRIFFCFFNYFYVLVFSLKPFFPHVTPNFYY